MRKPKSTTFYRDILVDALQGEPWDLTYDDLAKDWIGRFGIAGPNKLLATVIYEFLAEIVAREKCENLIRDLEGLREQADRKVKFFALIVNQTADALRPVFEYQSRHQWRDRMRPEPGVEGRRARTNSIRNILDEIYEKGK